MGREIMQHRTHARTLIAILRDYVEEWRKANGWSRESVADMIVQAHERLGAPRATGIHFDPPTRDAFERMRVNADRIFRWLDDVTKDRNHLPANFIPSLLYALPADLRMHAVDELLRPVGIGCRVAVIGVDGAEGESWSVILRGMLTESSDASVALSNLMDGVAPGELERAQKELTEAIAVFTHALEAVEGQMGNDADKNSNKGVEHEN